MGLVGAAVAGGVATSVVGAGLSSLTAKKQSGAISAGQAQANAASEAGGQNANIILSPYLYQGENALTQYGNIAGVNGSDAAAYAMNQFTTSPGYQYQLQQGLRAVDAGAASKGILRSGATLKAEQTLGTNLASQDFSSYINRLSDLSGLGSRAATSAANADLGVGTQISGTNASAAGQQASIAGAEGTGLASAANLGIGSAVNGLFNYFNTPSTPGNLSNYGASANDYGTAPLVPSGFNIGGY